jgi:hypothetical protein
VSRVRGPDDQFELFVLAAGRAEESAAVLASYRSARVLEPFPRRGGASGERWRRIIGTHERMLAELEGRGRGRGLPVGPELRAFGRDLFEALLPGDVRRLFDVARAQRRQGALDLVFTSMLDWVADKPWELAFDPARREFLASSSVNFVRNAYTAVPADAPGPGRGRLRVLLVLSRPRGRPPLDDRAEATGLRRAFAALTARGRATLELVTRPTPAALQRRLAQGGVDVLHFVGHGHYDADEREGFLVLEDERGEARPLGAEALSRIICRRGLRLVFLNACETGRGGRIDWNRGMAPALVAAGVPAVVANQYPVLDAAATLFARELYRELAAGRAIGDATREARIALARELDAGRMDWAVPVVFARHPRESLR